MKNCFFEGDILIPQNVDMGKWSVVACDQYTSEREYWDDVENIVGDTPSTLRIMLPEIELTGDTTEKIAKINQTMKDYGNTGLFKEHKDSMIYVERKLSNGNIRCGLMGVIDLECYDYNKGATTLVRASEGTVLDRLPPRVKIRKDATYEMPHVMVLYNDPQDVVLSQVKKNKDTLEKAYDFTLMK